MSDDTPTNEAILAAMVDKLTRGIGVPIDGIINDHDDAIEFVSRVKCFVEELLQCTFVHHPNHGYLSDAVRNVDEVSVHLHAIKTANNNNPNTSVAFKCTGTLYEQRMLMLRAIRDYLLLLPVHDDSVKRAKVNAQLAWTRMHQYLNFGASDTMGEFVRPRSAAPSKSV